MAYNALWAELGQRRREPHGPTKGGQPIRHQTLGFGAAAPQGRWGSGPPRAAPSWLGGGVDPLPLSLYKGCPLAPSSSFIPLFLPSSPLLSLALAPLVWSWLGEIEDLEVLPPSERRRAAGFSVRSLLLSLCLCWTGARRTFLHRTCVELRRCHSFGTSSSSS